MADLIDRAKLLADIEAATVFSGRDSNSAEMRGANKIIDRIKSAVSIEAKFMAVFDDARSCVVNIKANPWILTTEKLPEDGEVVQIWCGEQQIARFRRGISAAERDAMKRGELEDPEEVGWSLSTGYMTHKRSDVFKDCDEWGNNKAPYIWESTCSPMKWFGQDVTHWKPKDEPPIGYKKGANK